jgi:hypothetical protein
MVISTTTNSSRNIHLPTLLSLNTLIQGSLVRDKKKPRWDSSSCKRRYFNRFNVSGSSRTGGILKKGSIDIAQDVGGLLSVGRRRSSSVVVVVVVGFGSRTIQSTDHVRICYPFFLCSWAYAETSVLSRSNHVHPCHHTITRLYNHVTTQTQRRNLTPHTPHLPPETATQRAKASKRPKR